MTERLFHKVPKATSFEDRLTFLATLPDEVLPAHVRHCFESGDTAWCEDLLDAGVFDVPAKNASGVDRYNWNNCMRAFAAGLSQLALVKQDLKKEFSSGWALKLVTTEAFKRTYKNIAKRLHTDMVDAQTNGSCHISDDIATSWMQVACVLDMPEELSKAAQLWPNATRWCAPIKIPSGSTPFWNPLASGDSVKSGDESHIGPMFLAYQMGHLECAKALHGPNDKPLFNWVRHPLAIVEKTDGSSADVRLGNFMAWTIPCADEAPHRWACERWHDAQANSPEKFTPGNHSLLYTMESEGACKRSFQHFQCLLPPPESLSPIQIGELVCSAVGHGVPDVAIHYQDHLEWDSFPMQVLIGKISNQLMFLDGEELEALVAAMDEFMQVGEQHGQQAITHSWSAPKMEPLLSFLEVDAHSCVQRYLGTGIDPNAIQEGCQKSLMELAKARAPDALHLLQSQALKIKANALLDGGWMPKTPTP